MFGAYFPSWMFCLLVAIIIALLLRVIFIRLGIDDILPFRLTAYTAIVIAIASSLALFVYGR
ncbi:YtcA family lipoprotein [Brucella gallinifaecis]|uniref:YtcA family lipoprotein n=1 Tax=Brucella gallinifaecis TaxID=215590 RepID=UPI00387E36D3